MAVRDIVPTLREAFRQAVSGVPGPCFVELPLDLLYPADEMKAAVDLLERVKVRKRRKEL